MPRIISFPLQPGKLSINALYLDKFILTSKKKAYVLFVTLGDQFAHMLLKIIEKEVTN